MYLQPGMFPGDQHFDQIYQPAGIFSDYQSTVPDYTSTVQVTRSRTTSLASTTLPRELDFNIDQMPTEFWPDYSAHFILTDFFQTLQSGPNPFHTTDVRNFARRILDDLGKWGEKLFRPEHAVAIFDAIIGTFKGNKNVLQEIGRNIFGIPWENLYMSGNAFSFVSQI